MATPRVVCVLGMHRTGTSALARSLPALGIDLGDELISPYIDNPKGFFEDSRVLTLNRQLLERIGRDWDSIGLFDEEELLSGRHEDIFTEAVRLVENRTTRFGIWGFKEPRTTHLIPFWKKVFESLGLPVAYLISIRNPINVARSLKERNNLSHYWSLIMWLQHYYSAFRFTEGEWRLVVDYDLLVSDAGSQLRRISAFLGPEAGDDRQEAIREFCEDFLEDDLRHHRVPRQELNQLVRSVPYLTDLYAWALKLAEDEIPGNNEEMDLLRRVRESLQSISGFLDLFENYHSRLSSLQFFQAKTEELQAWCEALTSEKERLHKWCGLFDTGYANLLTAYESLNSKYDGVHKQCDSLDSGYHNLLTLADSLESRYDSLMRNYGSLNSEYDKLRDRHDHLGSEIIGLKEQNDLLRRELEQIKDLLSLSLKGRRRHWVKDLVLVCPSSPRQTWKRIKDARTIMRSGLFDGEFYLRRYLDVALGGIDPLAHFLISGAGEARDPGPHFNTGYYLETNRDVAEAGINPLIHYIQCGMREGRAPLPPADRSR
ncbi:MAG: hypothetical protein AB9866_18670 [Syntrophobacteraceae bacterium]